MRVWLLNRAPAVGQDIAQQTAADHLAHGALGDRFHRAVRIADPEQVFRGVRDVPLHRERQVDDVLVPGKHQALVRRLRTRRAADHGLVLVGDRDQLRLLDRNRQVVVQPGSDRSGVAAKPGDYRLLISLHRVDTGDHPAERGDREDRPQHHRPEALTIRPTKGAASLIVQPAHQIVQVGDVGSVTAGRPAARLLATRRFARRLSPVAAWRRAPGAGVGVVIPRHAKRRRLSSRPARAGRAALEVVKPLQGPDM